MSRRYALDADAPHHTAARALLEGARDGSTTLYVTPQILSEFYAVVTNARRVAKPRSSAEALDAISELLKFLHVLPVPAHVMDGWMNLVRRHPVTGADVFDCRSSRRCRRTTCSASTRSTRATSR